MRKMLTLLAFALGVIAVHSAPVAVPIEQDFNVVVVDLPQNSMEEIIKLSCVDAQVKCFIMAQDRSCFEVVALNDCAVAELPSNAFKHYIAGKSIGRRGLKHSRYESRPPNTMGSGVLLYQRLC
jgi:hypothetical protein